jgi:hypothetical protein
LRQLHPEAASRTLRRLVLAGPHNGRCEQQKKAYGQPSYSSLVFRISRISEEHAFSSYDGLNPNRGHFEPASDLPFGREPFL